MAMAADAARSGPVPIEAGDVDVTAVVQVSFALLPG
jgi:hypothetical protein